MLNMKLERYFLLNWKKVLIIIGSWVLAVLLHNLLSALLGLEEAFFFIVAVFIIPIYVLFSVIYTIVYYVKKK